MVRGLLVLSAVVAGTAFGGPERCNGFEGAKCAEIRNAAIAQGCINPMQAQIFTVQNVVPMCVGNSMVGVCSCGCFAPEALIGVAPGKELKAADIYAMPDVDSVLQAKVIPGERPDVAPTAITEKMQGNESQALVRLELGNGRSIRLTTRHPVVLADGRVVTAREIGRGAYLMGHSGERVRVANVGRDHYEGKVFNFKGGEDRTLIAEAVVVGDLALQNALEDEAEGIRQRE